MPDGTKLVRFQPVSAWETPEAVEMLCNEFNEALKDPDMDPLLLMPVFILDFLCIHPFNDGNGRMSRLLTLLLLYKNGYSVGKYISIEKQIEKTKDRYYDVLGLANTGWHEETNDPTPFIRYMLTVILACYTEFEDRVGLTDKSGASGKAYDVVRKYVEEKVGKFTGVEVVANCPSIGRSSALAALKKLTDEGLILRRGAGRGTYYVRANSVES
jgi:Fic family protein